MYGKIPKISPGAYIFQRIFLSRAYFWRGFIYSGVGGGMLIYGGKFVLQNRLGLYLEGNLCLKIDWASILVEGNCIDVTV